MSDSKDKGTQEKAKEKTKMDDDDNTTREAVDDKVADAPSTNVRAARRAQREAERAARAQRKADVARQRAMEAARAGGLFEGMQATTGATPTAGAGAANTASPSTPSAAVPAALTSAAAQTSAHPPEDDRGSLVEEQGDPHRQRKQRNLIRILAAASVVLLVIAGVASWQYVEAREATQAEQQIADAPMTATDAAREIATQMFTYDHRTVDADLAAVRDKLTEPALGEFVEESMPTVASAAKQQEASVYATVAAAAPQETIDENNVVVLVMLNRMVSTKESPEAASSASRLSLKMTNEDGIWKLAELDAL